MDIDFTKDGSGLVPAVVQDAVTGKILMLGYMNREAYDKTVKTGKVTFFSRSRQKLWTKGETSGNYLTVKSILPDCDRDTLLIKAIPTSPEFLTYLEGVIIDRRDFPVEGSYTNHLFSKGVAKIAQKVGEEAVELVIEAMSDNKQLFLGEAADLMYHLFVLLAQKGYAFSEVIEVLKNRHSR